MYMGGGMTPFSHLHLCAKYINHINNEGFR